jgi:hypothetical protein
MDSKPADLCLRDSFLSAGKIPALTSSEIKAQGSGRVGLLVGKSPSLKETKGTDVTNVGVEADQPIFLEPLLGLSRECRSNSLTKLKSLLFQPTARESPAQARQNLHFSDDTVSRNRARCAKMAHYGAVSRALSVAE